MPSVLDLLHARLGPQGLVAIGQQLGLDPTSVQRALATAIPVLTGGLARSAASPQGAAALQRALAQHHGGDGVFARDLARGRAVLRHIFTGREEIAAESLARSTGLDTASAGLLLTLLAPAVMAALASLSRDEQLDPADIAGIVLAQHDQARDAAPPELRAALPGMLSAL
jgi:hypothetical protein